MIARTVLLVNTNRIRPPVAPVALDYIGAAVRAVGHRVRLLDLCFAEDADHAVATAFADARPDLVALTFRNTDDCYFASRRSFIDVLVADMRRVRSYFDGPIVVGGCGFSLMPIAVLERVGADYGVRGDGEVALVELLSALPDAPQRTRVPGLVYRRRGTWHANRPARTDLRRFDLSPRDVVDNRRYFNTGGQAGIETKRGCPGRCVYCADPVIKGHRVRLRDPAEIVREIGNLLDQGVDCFHWCDSEFNLPVAHAMTVCQAIVAAGLGDRILWYTYAAPTPFPRELATSMRRAGCVGINFGVDSGCDAMLAALGRNYKSSCLAETARASRRAGIAVMYDLLLGGPGETRTTVTETIGRMRQVQPDRVGISLGVRLYPGTPLAEQLDRQGQDTGMRADRHEDSLAPRFYLAPELGSDPESFVRELIGDDPRFFLPGAANSRDDNHRNYNYNDNRVLEQAIAEGYRGAYWDILRRLEEGCSPG